MKLFVVLVTVMKDDQQYVLCDAVVSPTLNEALSHTLKTIEESHPKDEGWRGHKADGFQVNEQLIDEVVMSRKN